MTFDEIRDKIKNNNFIISQHAFIESAKEKIEDEDIRYAILNGAVIEAYPEDTRGSSLLVSGKIRDGKPLHVVLGIALDEPVIITVYIPSPPKWKSPTERGGSRK
ncbi:MAG TPA: DUF4258 domain-containing protein [Nitrospirota bacterium]|nr:DUF4258 domain-containing protein [Nitrospirota bacterium]